MEFTGMPRRARQFLPWFLLIPALLAPCLQALAGEARPLGGCLVLDPDGVEAPLPRGVRDTCLARGRNLDTDAWREGLEPLEPVLRAAHALASRHVPGEKPAMLALYHQAFPHAATLQTEAAVFILIDDGLLDSLERAVSALLADWAPRLALPDRFPGPGLEDWLEILRTPVAGNAPVPRPAPADLRENGERLNTARPYLVAALAFVLAHERAHAYSAHRTCGYRGLDPLALEMACDRNALLAFRGTPEQERMTLTVLSWLLGLGYRERYWHDRIRRALVRESPFGDQKDLLVARQWIRRARALHALWQQWPRERHWPRALEKPMKRYLDRLLDGRPPVPASDNPPACRRGLRLHVEKDGHRPFAARLRVESLRTEAVEADVEIQWRAMDDETSPPTDSRGRHYRVRAHVERRLRVDPGQHLELAVAANRTPAPDSRIAPTPEPAARIFRCRPVPAAPRSPLFLRP